MGNYKDRGILKWAPFDALDGHHSTIETLIFNLNKKQKRSLSEDSYSDLNEELEKAITKNLPVEIAYYKNGYTYTIYGLIKKVNSVDKILVLESKEELEFDSILDLSVVEK